MSQAARHPTASDPPLGDPPPADELQDVQPILERSPDSIWARVDRARDKLCNALEQACEAKGFDALVIKSGPFTHPAWVRLVCWIPDPENGRKVTERGYALVMIWAKEFHRYKLEYTVEVHDRGWVKTYPPLREFGPKDAGKLAHFLLSHGRRPKFAKRLRQRPYELWKKKNKVDELRTDWLRVAPAALAMLGLLTVLHAVPLGLLFLVGAGVAFSQLRRRREAVLSSGRPGAEPRQLHLVDYWQAVISGLGDDTERLRKRFLTVLQNPPMTGFNSWVEQIWEWGLDGKVEREQIVLTLRRGLVFCQIYEYDRELYVGWNAYLNSGQWVEDTVAIGIHKKIGKLTRVNTVLRGSQPLGEYDLVDLDCLIEWAHWKLVELVKRLMEERKIDQKIDFKILRGKRQGLTTTEESRTGGARRSGRKLLRTG